jgi:glucose/arabinose dehydrogenase
MSLACASAVIEDTPAHHGLGRVIFSRAARFVFGITLLAAASSQAATLPAGFSESVVASGLSSPTAIAFAPDGRLFICEQGGRLRVVKNGALLPTPFVTLTVSSLGERGLLGVAFDPFFSLNGFVYLYYTATSPTIHNRVSRFTANGDVAVAGSEVVLLELDTLGATNHNGGAIHFGIDGKLYIAVGDNANGANAQSLGTRLGKMLRINRDGSIPIDNPFFTMTTGVNRAIWAMGLRNPFTFTFQPLSGRMFINDVGETTWEEIDDGVAGANYGWPTTEGPTSDPRFNSPLYAYNHSNGCAITGGAFYNPQTGQFPPAYTSAYFFADYCGGWIRLRDPDTGIVINFASGISAPVDLKVGNDDGSLYYLARGPGGASGAVFRIDFGATAPSITVNPAPQTAAVGESATFQVTASGTPLLSYQWFRNGIVIPGATSRTYTIQSAVAADDGALFRVLVSNDFGLVISLPAMLTVLNTPPVGTITLPLTGAKYSAGQTVIYAGTGQDLEDGALPPSAFTWWVDFHHDTHTHPFLPPTSGAMGGSFVVPTTGETSANVWYRIYLQVTDSRGLSHTSFRDVTPRTVQITLTSVPSALQVTLDGQPHTTPFTITGVVGMTRSLGIVTPQVKILTWGFLRWSDLGASTHDINTPATSVTYTATFQAVQCGADVSSLVDIVDLGTFPVLAPGLNLQILAVRNHTILSIPGPLTLMVGNLQNAVLVSPDRTLCGPTGNDPAVLVHATDDRLAGLETTVIGLLFYKTATGEIIYTSALAAAP